MSFYIYSPKKLEICKATKHQLVIAFDHTVNGPAKHFLRNHGRDLFFNPDQIYAADFAHERLQDRELLRKLMGHYFVCAMNQLTPQFACSLGSSVDFWHDLKFDTRCDGLRVHAEMFFGMQHGAVRRVIFISPEDDKALWHDGDDLTSEDLHVFDEE